MEEVFFSDFQSCAPKYTYGTFVAHQCTKTHRLKTAALMAWESGPSTACIHPDMPEHYHLPRRPFFSALYSLASCSVDRYQKQGLFDSGIAIIELSPQGDVLGTPIG